MSEKDFLSALSDLLDEKLEEKLDKILDEKLEEKLDKILDEKLEPLNTRLTRLEKVVEPIDGRLTRMEKVVESIDGRLTRLEKVVEPIGERLIHLERTVECDVVPRLRTIESCYLTTSERYLRSVDEHEGMKQDIEILKLVVENHSQRLLQTS